MYLNIPLRYRDFLESQENSLVQFPNESNRVIYDMKQRILELHQEGKSYREIEEILNCSKGTISYHLSPKTKSKHRANQFKRRNDRKVTAVKLMGGKCQNPDCGYDKCLAALELHHIDPTTKEYDSLGWRSLSEENMLKELKKCVLLCCRCHREFHAGVLNLELQVGIEPTT